VGKIIVTFEMKIAVITPHDHVVMNPGHLDSWSATHGQK